MDFTQGFYCLLSVIVLFSFREEEEIFNLWTAFLNLEANFGSDESLKAVFDNAIKNTDSIKMHKQMIKIYQNVGKIRVCKKKFFCFRNY